MSSWGQRLSDVDTDIRAAIIDELRQAGPAGLRHGQMRSAGGAPPPVNSLRLLARRGDIDAVPSSSANHRSPRIWVLSEHAEACRARLMAPPLPTAPVAVVPAPTVHYANPVTALPAGYVSNLDPRQCRPWAAAAAATRSA